MIPLSIELRRSYCTRLYTFIITTAHTKCTINHEQQCKIREPRNHITSQDVITWLNHKISLNVHQHNTNSSVSTQPIQRRVIFSDIYGCGGGWVLLFILEFIIVLFLSTNYDLYYCTSTYFDSEVTKVKRNQSPEIPNDNYFYFLQFEYDKLIL